MQMKGLDSALVVPSTSMAGRVLEEEVEIELDKIEVVKTADTGIEKEPAYEIIGVSLPLPPPPPIHQNNYSLVCSFHSALPFFWSLDYLHLLILVLYLVP